MFCTPTHAQRTARIHLYTPNIRRHYVPIIPMYTHLHPPTRAPRARAYAPRPTLTNVKLLISILFLTFVNVTLPHPARTRTPSPERTNADWVFPLSTCHVGGVFVKNFTHF
jgi:hypothetical protein